MVKTASNAARVKDQEQVQAVGHQILRMLKRTFLPISLNWCPFSPRAKGTLFRFTFILGFGIYKFEINCFIFPLMMRYLLHHETVPFA